MKLKKNNLKKWKKKKKKKPISIFLLRPLLEITRFDLKKLCQIWNLPVYPDITNQNFTSTRNRIRLQLLPILRFFFNPQIDTILTQFAQINLQEQNYLDYLSIRLIKDLFSKKEILQNETLSQAERLLTLCTQNVNLNSSKDFLYQPNRSENLVKLRKTPFYQEKYIKSYFYQVKAAIYKKEDLSFNVLYKFEFQNQPLFFIPLAIQRRISKKLIEYFLNKKVNFFHVEHIIEYLKDFQNLV